MPTGPLLKVQTGTLYASNDASTFTGTGGPVGFSPWTSQFGGVIGSAGLASEPFDDTLYSVAAGDHVVFVIAVQNMGDAPAMNVRLKDIMPTGFVVPPEGLGLTVTNGAGKDLAFSGDLFGAGLLIGPALPAYNPSSGLNVDLVTFTLDAGPALPGPNVTLKSSATVLSAAAVTGGANIVPGNTTATTAIVTASPTPVVKSVTDPSAVAVGQTVAFDVTVSVPAGTMRDLRLSPVLPTSGPSLTLVSASVTSFGPALQHGTPQIGADGTILFGDVTRSATATGDASVVARIVVRASGSQSGPANLQTVVSAAPAPGDTARWSAAVASGIGVVAPSNVPILSGVGAAWTTTPDTGVAPFQTLVLADSAVGQTATLAITLQNGGLGRLVATGGGSVDATGTVFTVSGTPADVQAAARRLSFTPGATGVARFTVTAVESVSGIGQDSATTVTVAAPPAPKPDPLFDPAFYLARNPDVNAAGVDPWVHYLTMGWKEGRDPNALFSTRDYLACNPDVAAAGVNPLVHFSAYGWHEGRAPNALFDPQYYLTQNPDVAAAGINPLLHFATAGWREGRDPSLLFSDSQYLLANRDVASAGINPLSHYLGYGRSEGRLAFLSGALSSADHLVDTAF